MLHLSLEKRSIYKYNYMEDDDEEDDDDDDDDGELFLLYS